MEKVQIKKERLILSEEVEKITKNVADFLGANLAVASYESPLFSLINTGPISEKIGDVFMSCEVDHGKTSSRLEFKAVVTVKR